ncbi:MAG: hypothetical protein J7L88_00470, partial [Thermoplasmata archaeon]|nr:hypothetical protein [Thermoplasmata archaeon]
MRADDVHYRLFRPEDVEAVLQIASSRFREEYTAALLLQIYGIFPEGFLVAEVEGRVIGYITAVPHYPSSLRVLMLAVK